MPAPAPIPMPAPASTGPAPTLTPMPYTGLSRQRKRGLPNATMIFMLLGLICSNEALMVRFKSGYSPPTHPSLELQTSNLKPQTSNLKPQTSNLKPQTALRPI